MAEAQTTGRRLSEAELEAAARTARAAALETGVIAGPAWQEFRGTVRPAEVLALVAEVMEYRALLRAELRQPA